VKIKLAVLMIAGCAAAMAQRSNAYVFAAPGAATAGWSSAGTLHFGGGGEVAIAKGIAAGAEIGALTPPECFSCVVGVLSPGAGYHFVRNPRSKIDPFAGGGYSLFFRSGHTNLWYFGGGVNYWFRRHTALRVELRDHVYAEYGNPIHFWGVRVGFTFR
jgi:hypothetical protein